MAMDVNNMVFVGLNSRVAALDRNSGGIEWQWRAPTGSGYVSLLLLDKSRLIVSVSGYTYCLDPSTGDELWYNELKGFGTGVTSLAAFGMKSEQSVLLGAAAADAAAAAAAAS